MKTAAAESVVLTHLEELLEHTKARLDELDAKEWSPVERDDWYFQMGRKEGLLIAISELESYGLRS